jgi:hypothetical protein
MYQFMPTKSESVNCPWGTLPVGDKSYCKTIPQTYLDYSEALSMGAMIVTTLGLAATIAAVVTFMRYSNTNDPHRTSCDLGLMNLGRFVVRFPAVNIR